MTEYIRDCGYNVIEMWECEWKAYKKDNKTFNAYVYPTEAKYYRMSEKQILASIEEDKIFGAVEVDIHVPDNLKAHFEEMTPIFKNTIVRQDDIGEYMQEFLKETGRTFNDTRYLIGSMFASKILLITPLIQWYMSHGLVVTKIHQVIEFSPKQCFQNFADDVSNDRRAGWWIIVHIILFKGIPWQEIRDAE